MHLSREKLPQGRALYTASSALAVSALYAVYPQISPKGVPIEPQKSENEYMTFSEEKKSRFLMEFFALALLASLLLTWYTIIVRKDFVVFTDKETVPEPTDFFAAIPDILSQLWTR